MYCQLLDPYLQCLLPGSTRGARNFCAQGGIVRRARRRRPLNPRHRRTVLAASDGTSVVYWTSCPLLPVTSRTLGHGFCALVLWPPFVCARVSVARVCEQGIFSFVRPAEFLL